MEKPWQLPDLTSLEDISGLSLAMSAAALQLVPANNERLLRLERIATTGAFAATDKKLSDISPSRLRKIVNSEAFSGRVNFEEDPYDETFVQAAHYGGQSYLVSAGLCERAVWNFNILSESFQRIWDQLPAPLAQELNECVTLLLRISDRVLKNAGFSRGARPLRGRGEPISVPNRERLSSLRDSLLLLPEETDDRVLGPLTFADDELATPPFSGGWNDDNLLRRPFIKSESGTFLAAPLEIVSCLRVRLISHLLHAGYGELFAQSVRTTLLERLISTLEGEGRTLIATREILDGRADEVAFQDDNDSFLSAILLVDRWEDFEPLDPCGHWDNQSLQLVMRTWMTEEAERLASATVLTIIEPLGRGMFFGMTDAFPELHIHISLADLEVLTFHERHPLALRRFAQERQRLETARSISFSALDEFALYRDNDNSLYMSDGPNPSMILFEVGSGAALRFEMYERLDLHYIGAPAWNESMIAVVKDSIAIAPIYMVPRVRGELIESHGTEVWVLPAQGQSEEPAIDNLVSLVAFWTLEAFKSAQSLDETTLIKTTSTKILVGLHDSRYAGQSVVQFHRVDEKVIRVSIDPELPTLNLTSQNDADRAIVSELCQFLEEDGAYFRTSRGQTPVDLIAPKGPKTMLTIAPPDDLTLNPGTLPSALQVEPAVTARILDELGLWLRVEVGWSIGTVTPALRVHFLNECVDHYFARLREELSSLDSAGLLRAVVTLDESAIHKDEMISRTLGARLSCFEYGKDDVDRMIRDRKLASESRVASRFLVEYIVAQPPQGTKPLSVDKYELLLALASEIVNKGALSDSIYYGLASPQLSILESGRLGIDHADRFLGSSGEFIEDNFRAGMESALAPKIVLVEDESKAPDTTLEVAMVSEFGFTFEDFAQAAGLLLNTNWPPRDNDVTALAIEEVYDLLQSGLGWNQEKIEALLDATTLSPREHFYPEGNRAAAYPWRFGRDLSYLRRPFLRQRLAGGRELLCWGPRRLVQTGPYWLSLIHSARLTASTKPLQKYISVEHNKVTERFNDAVAERLASVSDHIVKTRVKKFRGRKVQSNDRKDLGDIDVICLNKKSKTVWVIEAKDFGVARTPYEFRREIDKIASGQKNAVKHQRRVDWIQRNLQIVLGELDPALERQSGYSVRGMFVTSDDLLAARLANTDFPVVPFQNLTRAFSALNQRPARTRGGRRR